MDSENPSSSNTVDQIVSDDDEIDYSVKPEFYDPCSDDKDEAWLERRRKGRSSDALLSCPACFTTLCIDCQRLIYNGTTTASPSSTSSRAPGSTPIRTVHDFFVPRNTPGAQPSLEAIGWNKEVHEQADIACVDFWYFNNIPFNVASSPYWQNLVTALTVVGKGYKAPSRTDLSGRHEKYVTQYRAMFVLNCKIVDNQRLRLPSGTKRKRENKKISRGQCRSNNDNLPETTSENLKDEVFKPVCCSVCQTEVAVLDEDEIYHFFNVMPSYA